MEEMFRIKGKRSAKKGKVIQEVEVTYLKEVKEKKEVGLFHCEVFRDGKSLGFKWITGEEKFILTALSGDEARTPDARKVSLRTIFTQEKVTKVIYDNVTEEFLSNMNQEQELRDSVHDVRSPLMF